MNFMSAYFVAQLCLTMSKCLSDDEPDALLALSKPEDAATDLLLPPPAKRAKYTPVTPNVSTTTQSFSESLEDVNNLTEEDDPVNRSFEAALKSTGGGALSTPKRPSSLKQLLLVPRRQPQQTVLPPDLRAMDPQNIHSSFMQQFRIPAKYRAVVAADLARANPEASISFESDRDPAPRVRKLVSPTPGSLPEGTQVCYSDLLVLDGFGPPPAPTAVPSTKPPKRAAPPPQAPVGKAASSPKKRPAKSSSTPKKAAPKSAAKSPSAKRTAAPTRSTLPKPPPLTSEALRSTVATNSGASTVISTGPETESVAATLLIGLSAKSSKSLGLGQSSPSIQSSIIKYVSPQVPPKIPERSN